MGSIEGTSSGRPLIEDYSQPTDEAQNGIPMRPVAARTSLCAIRTLTNGEPRQQRAFDLRRTATSLFTPKKKIAPAPAVCTWRSIRSIICASWPVNVLLVFIPLSWALNFADKDQHTLIFLFSFLAIIPLAKLLDFATDELTMQVGRTLACLLDTTLGNGVELIVGIIALTKCQLQVVQSSLVGSILSNLLLGLGMCFFTGGIKFSEQGFGASAARLNSSLLTISVVTVLLPAAFRFFVTLQSAPDSGNDILNLSHGVAIILLFIYGSYLFFQLYSHITLYSDDSPEIAQSTKYSPREHKFKIRKEGDATGTDVTSFTASLMDTKTAVGHEPEEEVEEPQFSLYMAIGLLIVVAVVKGITAEYLVDSIDGLTGTGHIRKEFVGMILLPILGNAAEHATAVSDSVKDNLNLSLSAVVGSSIQIALFVIPFIVVVGWILDKPLTMLFDPYESVALFFAVITLNYIVQDGKSNWLEGMILMCLYVILGTTFWFYPGTSEEFSSILPACT